MADMTLTLDKEQLLGELNAKRAEVFDSYRKKEIEELEDMLTKVVSKETIREQMADYYAEIVEGLREERYEIGASGQVKGAPPKPKVGGLVASSKRRSNHWYHWTEDDMRRQLEAYKEQRDNAVKPLDAAIKLLNMSKDSEVTISSGDYQNLLSGADRHGRMFY